MKEKKVLSNVDFLELLKHYNKYSYLPCCKFLRKDISRHFELSNEQIKVLDQEGILDWGVFCSSRTFSIEFLKEFKNKIDWRVILRTHKLSEFFISSFAENHGARLHGQLTIVC